MPEVGRESHGMRSLGSADYDGQDRGTAAAYASYFAGMDASMQQKVALTTAHFPTRGRVADMGSGSGRGTYDLACLHPGLELIGVDINPTAVATASATYRRANLRYMAGDIADPVFPAESLDGILDSSVLHHVTSFTGYGTRRLEECLDHQVAALRPGGVLIIRDFVVPDGPDEVLLDLPAEDGALAGDAIGALSTSARWERYAATVRNGRYAPGDLPWSPIPGAGPGWRRIRCRLRDAQEFLLRKDYTTDWDVELLEEYTYWTQAEFIAALVRRGLRVTTAAPIRNPWIIANRYRGHARLTTCDGAPLPFPPTNLVIVGQKVGAGQGTRLVLDGSAPVTAPLFLRLHGWRGTDGRSYDLAERPGRAIDVIPWFRRDGQLLVLAKQGFPRPLVVADPQRPNLTGATWSGYLTEPIAAIVDPAEPLAQAVGRILAERASIAEMAIRGLSPVARYATSPGGLDEVVDAVLVEIAPDAPAADTIAELDALACLRAAQVGGLFDARLELNIYRLLRILRIAPGAWIGAAVPACQDAPQWPLSEDALRPADLARFAPMTEPGGFLAIHRGRFSERGADGQVLGTTEREWVASRMSGNTASVLPVLRVQGRWCVGVEHRWLPAIQQATGTAGFAAVPAWRLPQEVGDLPAAESWLAAQLMGDFGCAARELVELGGAYLATPGATPELVHPWLAVIDAGPGPGRLHWLPVIDALAQPEALVDAHLAIALRRFAHAAGIPDDP